MQETEKHSSYNAGITTNSNKHSAPVLGNKREQWGLCETEEQMAYLNGAAMLQSQMIVVTLEILQRSHKSILWEIFHFSEVGSNCKTKTSILAASMPPSF